MLDKAPKLKTREELEKEWWDRWRKLDYSWSGLADKYIDGEGDLNGSISLQDYWRREPGNSSEIRSDQALEAAGELFRGPDGRLWHLAHVPLLWEDGTRGKAGWSPRLRSFLKRILVARLKDVTSANATDSRSDIVGVDCRAQFEGVVVPNLTFRLPNREEVAINSVNFDNAWFSSVTASNRKFGHTTSFSNVFFAGHVRFNEAVFDGSINFRSVAFLKDASFRNAKFLGQTRFSGALFLDIARLDKAHFSDTSEFLGAKFLSQATFNSVVFSGAARFTRAWFREVADFDDSSFEGLCDFQAADFKQVYFRRAKFNQRALFRESIFRERLTFEGSATNDLVSFYGISWPENAWGWHSSFKGVHFGGRAEFDLLDCKGFAAFDGAMFARQLEFGSTRDRVALATFLKERGQAIHASRKDYEDWELATKTGSRDIQKMALDRDVKTIVLQRFRDSRLAELERGCRVLKQAMAEASDKPREHMFYRFELMARNAQSTTPFQERWSSRVYEVISEYGTSITLPLMFLLLTWAIAALTYVSIGVVAAPEKIVPWQWSWDAFDLSLSRVFQPLTFWSAANLQDNSLGLELVGQKDRGLLALCVRLIGTIQSLISIILLFLSGLALRRRFQIN